MTLTTEDSNSFFREMLEKTQDFDCTVQILNDFLFQQAVEDNSKAVSRTHFLILNDRIVGFYTIAIDNVDIDVINNKAVEYCTAPQKLDMKNLTFGVFFYEINL